SLVGSQELVSHQNSWKRPTKPTYLGTGDPARQRTDYYPPWLDNLADEVTMGGSVLNGIMRRGEDIRTVPAYARPLYEYQGISWRCRNPCARS
ncbi:hypothetical protein, partial [Nonomuraea sp. NPDC003804]|uniref:hypothetical protein n=1 Tax=Nonomuraea sp. NPDC003804 TaxID=3154547 RepID=UPI0033AC3985